MQLLYSHSLALANIRAATAVNVAVKIIPNAAFKIPDQAAQQQLLPDQVCTAVEQAEIAAAGAAEADKREGLRGEGG